MGSGGHSRIKLLHFSDLHLGTENYGKTDPTTGLNSRLLDFAKCFDQAVDTALAEDVDLVVFSGDAYRSRDPSPTHQREFARRIQRLASAGIPVFLLVGNHDLPLHLGKANSMDIFETLSVSNVVVGRKPAVHRIGTRRGMIQIAAMPWIVRGMLLAREEFKNKTLDQINDDLAQRMARIIEGLAEDLDPQLPAVLCAHMSVMGAEFGSERSIMLGQDVVVPRSTVLNPKFDYVALGHIHKHQVISSRPLAVYAGSIERVDFGEERDKKGFVLVDVAKGEADYRFKPVAAREFLTVEVTADGEDPLAQVLAAIGRHDVSEAVVRLVIHTSPEREGRLPYVEIRKALKDAHVVAAINKQVGREERHRLGAVLAEAMTPREALLHYFKTKNAPDDRQKVLLRYAAQLMEAER